MSKYLVETFYTCTFKIVHKLDELNEKKLSELEIDNDGKFEIIDVKLNNRKTKTVNDKNNDSDLKKSSSKEFQMFFQMLLMKKLLMLINLNLTNQIEANNTNTSSLSNKNK